MLLFEPRIETGNVLLVLSFSTILNGMNGNTSVVKQILPPLYLVPGSCSHVLTVATVTPSPESWWVAWTPWEMRWGPDLLPCPHPQMLHPCRVNNQT